MAFLEGLLLKGQHGDESKITNDGLWWCWWWHFQLNYRWAVGKAYASLKLL